MCSCYVIGLNDRAVHVLEEFVLETGATHGQDYSRLEVRPIRSGASRYRPWDVVWMDFMAPPRHLVVDVTVPSARMNTMFLIEIGARSCASHSRAVLHWELSMANSMRTSAVLRDLARFRFGESIIGVSSL
jgi:hypothetical protein